VHHALDPVIAEHAGQARGIAQRDLVEGGAGVDRLTMAAHEVIDRRDLMPGLDQLFDGVRADVARPAHDEGVHGFPPSDS